MLQTAIMDNSQDILFKVENNVGWITLNRPRALNALTLDMIMRMSEKLRQWEEDGDIKMIIVQGEGDRAFCSGGDIKSIAKQKGESFQTDFIREEYKLDYQISQLKTLYISVWDGIVMGGGVGISRMGHIRIATDRTLFAMPECGIGIIPDVGAGYFLSQLGHVGLYLGLTGTRVDGGTCLDLGLATHWCHRSQVPGILTTLSQLKDMTMDSVTRVLEQVSNRDIAGENMLARHDEEIRSTFGSAVTLSEIMQNLQSSQSEFSQETLDKINKCSPTSICIAFQQIKAAPSCYKEALEIEYRVMKNRFKDTDFYEGVRAAVIDKDHNPRWNPSSIEEVKIIDQYFKQAPSDLEL